MKEKRKQPKIGKEISYDEFYSGFHSSSSGLRNKASNSRNEQVTSCNVFVTDTTTGMKEEITIPEGNYSKKKMQKLRNDAVDKMVISLFNKRKHSLT